MNTLKERLTWARKKKGLTQTKLAELVGVKQATISDLETEKQSGSTHLPKIAALLGVDALWLQTGEGDPFDSPFLKLSPEQMIEAAKKADLPREKIAELMKILADRLTE